MCSVPMLLFSAGAHLAGSFGIQNIGYGKYHLPKPGVMFLGYPVITMGEMAHAGSRENFLGKENGDDYAKNWLERAVEFWENIGRYHNADK